MNCNVNIISFIYIYVFIFGLVPAYVDAKDRTTYYDKHVLSQALQNINKYQWAKDQLDSLTSSHSWLLGMADQELWDFVPPPEQLRSINVSSEGCPVCKKEIFRKGGHYPWIINRNNLFKVTCPICKKQFPENDFIPWNTSGPDGRPEEGSKMCDKGLGWKDNDGNRYYFVAYYIYWQRWQNDILGGLSALSKAYLLTGDQIYAHKCAVLLAKIATEYKKFNYSKQACHAGAFGVDGRISDYIWSNGDISKIALAYDAIYPVYKNDKKLINFLQEKKIVNPTSFIEKEMLHVMAQDIMSGFIYGNMGVHQKTLCELAIVLDNKDVRQGTTTTEIREWLMKGNGRIEDLLWNGFWREGMGGESAPHYSIGWVDWFYELAGLLPKLGVDIWRHPKMKNLADIGLKMMVAGKYIPSIGDSGSLRGTDAAELAWRANIYGRAFTHYDNPDYAKILTMTDKKNNDLFSIYYDENEIEQIVKETGLELGLKTRNLGGYGLAILESGKGENKRAVSMYYGDANGGHGHYDRLNIEMFAYGIPVLTEDGYPTPFERPDFYQWRRANTYRHFCVMVNEKPHENLFAGNLNTLVKSPTIQLMDASAEIVYPDITPLYRRTSALIDISEEKSYLLDIFRVRGGSQHDWCFHGPAFSDFTITGGKLGVLQKKGTLAGENVEYGADPSTDITIGGTEIPLELKSSPDIKSEANKGYWSLALMGWAQYGNGIITRKLGTKLRVNDIQVPKGAINILVRYYDYNIGSNELDVTISGVTKTVHLAASGREGYKWANMTFILPHSADEVSISASSIGQPCMIIDRVVISNDLNRVESKVQSVSSGFQGLFNVKRMIPEKTWSASWHNPSDNLSLSMNMLAGSTQEVIIAEGIPELGNNSPKTTQYLIARNTSKERGESKTKDILHSNYVATIEAYKGNTASIFDIKKLENKEKNIETVGLIINRGKEKDFMHSSLLFDKTFHWDTGVNSKITVNAEFAMLTLDDQGVRRACIVNGTFLKYEDFVLKANPSPLGKVVSVNPKENSIVIDKVLDPSVDYSGMEVIIGNEYHSTSYTIKNVNMQEDKTVLYFGDIPYIIRTGDVHTIIEDKGTIISATNIKGYGFVEGDRLQGRWVYNEDKSFGLKIKAIEGNKFYLENIPNNWGNYFKDFDGDVKRKYWISDIGPGDSFRIPIATYFKR